MVFQLPPPVSYREESFPAGSDILSGLDSNDSLFLLTAGVADVIYWGLDGESMRIYRYRAPDLFGEVELLTGRSQPLPVVAAEDCTVLRIQRGEALRWMERDFSFCRGLMERLCEKLYDNMYCRTEQRYLTQRQRYLLAIKRHARQGTLSAVTKASLCQELAIPLRSLNRVVAQCREQVRYEKGKFLV